MKAFKIYYAYFLQFLKTRLEYKKDFFVGIFANLIATLSGLLFIYLLMDGKVVPSLKGWSREEILFIYGYSMISMAFFSTVSRNLYGFGDRYVIQGQFDNILMRPLNSLCQVLFESFNLDVIGSFFLGVFLIVKSSHNLGLSFQIFDSFWIIFSGFCGGVIVLSVFVALASFSFHFEDRVGIMPPFYSLIHFSRYPLSIFSNVIQFILSFIVPFAFASFYPATHFFDKKGYEVFCYMTPVVALICASVAYAFWQFGVSKYSSTGN